MGNAKFWFYPEPGNHLVEIDLGESLGELFFDFEYDQETAVSMSGGMYRTVTMSRQIITIQRDRMKLNTAKTITNKLRAMENHLNRGFSVAFCSDSDRAYCYPVSNSPNGGDSSFQAFGDPFFQMTGGGNLPSSGDFIAFDTPGPASTFETIGYSSTTGAFTASNGGQINLANPFAFSYNGRPAFARYWRFWPILKMPSSMVGSSIVTNEHGLFYSLSLRLVPDMNSLFAFHPLMIGEESTVDFNFIQPGEIIPPDQIFGDSNGFTTLDRHYPDRTLKPFAHFQERRFWEK